MRERPMQRGSDKRIAYECTKQWVIEFTSFIQPCHTNMLVNFKMHYIIASVKSLIVLFIMR